MGVEDQFGTKEEKSKLVIIDCGEFMGDLNPEY
jgi:hypothetical protein